jgi:hypothetical protein
LFRNISLSQNDFGTRLEILGGCQNCSGNFWDFSREKKPEMFRSCRNRFGCFSQMKITNPELFRNASKILLVGTGIFLRPTEKFWILRSQINVFMNSGYTIHDDAGDDAACMMMQAMMQLA